MLILFLFKKVIFNCCDFIEFEPIFKFFNVYVYLTFTFNIYNYACDNVP